MKQKITLLLFSFLVYTGISLAQDTPQLIVDLKNGNTQQIELSTLRTVTFQDNNLSLNLIGNINTLFELSAIKSVYFTNITPSAIEDITLFRDAISIYPNPAENIIYIKNLPENVSGISIIRPDGSMVMSVSSLASDNSVNIGSLPRGFYLLRINNQVLKFYKL